jgi:hypothetical protein
MSFTSLIVIIVLYITYKIMEITIKATISLWKAILSPFNGTKKSRIERKCDKYFESNGFIQLKKSHSGFIEDMNDLSDHIEELKKTSEYFSKAYYGVSEYNGGNNNYNYRHPNQNDIECSSSTYDCSLSVLNNARVQPFKYVCKYFNIDKSERTLNVLQDILNAYLSIEDAKQILINKKEILMNEIERFVPEIVKKNQRNRIEKELGLPSISFEEIYIHRFIFRYTSAGGNSEQTKIIELTTDTLEDFISYISENMGNKGNMVYQHPLMTRTLRAKIKQRDDFTCKICKNSILNEPNLLLEINHIIPPSKGGTYSEDNLQTLCWKCNRIKKNKIFSEGRI